MNASRYVLSAAALVALGACSDNSMGPSRLSAPDRSSAVIVPALSGVIVGTGSFANTVTTGTEVGKDNGGPFWGNPSSDDGQIWPNANKCNIGYFATTGFGPNCLNSSIAATPGGYTGGAYYGTGTGNLDAPAFMFSGQYKYDVKLVGAFSAGTSTVGWFTKSGGVYTLHAEPNWSSKTLNTVTINTGGADWGFFATNANFTGVRQCGATTNTACSDALGGGAEGTNSQQFALFTNSGGTQFLVGLEDNRLSPLWRNDSPANPTNRDSDYNDYIFQVVPSVIQQTTTWCSPGFWKNNGRDLWTSKQGMHYSDLAKLNIAGFPAALSKKAPAGYDPTLLEVIDNPNTYGGEAANSVADYLSNLAFGTKIGSGIESCPSPDAIKPI